MIAEINEFSSWPHVIQSLASLVSTYQTTDIHLVSEYGRRPLCSSTDRTLTVPRTHNRFGNRSFAVAGPPLWNSLPISLRQISSFGQFKRYLKNDLFGIWEITAQCDACFSALYKYSYLLNYIVPWTLLSQLPNGISICSAVFCTEHPYDPHTDTQTTLRVTPVQ